MSEDWELIQGCRRHDTGSWQTLVSRYERLVMSIPLRYGLTRNDAEDVTQQTFINFMDGLKSFHPESNVKAWLITVARRNSWRFMERYDREQVHAAEDLGDSALALGLRTTDKPADHFVLDWLDAGLHALDERCRELLIALYFEQEKPSYDALAERFDLARNSIGAIRARCLERLKRNLSDE